MRHSFLRKARYLLAALCVTLILGCGNGNRKMGGKISFSDTGEPLTFGTVAFSNESNQFRGNIQKNGQYTIGTLSDNDGLPKGDYQVSIDAVVFEGYNPKGRPIEKHVIDPKYRRPETSGLSITVDGSSKQFDIEVDRSVSK